MTIALAIRIVTALNAILFLIYVILWARARQRDRQGRGEEAARPRCKHGRDRLRKPECEACYAETKAYFEDKEKKDNPFIITTGLSEPITFAPYAITATAEFTPGNVTYHATTSTASYVPRLPRKGEWWTPTYCFAAPSLHKRSIPVYVDWTPTPHEIERARCGCFVYGKATL